MNEDLLQIAEQAKYDAEQNNDDEEVVIHTGITSDSNTEVTQSDTFKDDDFSLSEVDLRASMPKVSDEYFNSIKVNEMKDLNSYQRSLIIDYGFTPNEAFEAVSNRLKKRGKELQDKFLVDNPEIVTINVDKKESSNIMFTESEKKKLIKSKIIKVNEIEDAALKSLNILPVKSEFKLNYALKIRSALSRDVVPLIRLADNVEFAGAQIAELYSAISYEDENIVEGTMRSARLIYDKLIGGINYKKYDSDGNIILSFEEFMNSFPFYDMDMALYSILCASSPDETRYEAKCPKCGKKIEMMYNVRSLINFDDCPEKIKSRIDSILAIKSDGNALLELQHDLVRYVKRIESPFTKNIYELHCPSIAKMIKYMEFGEVGTVEKVSHLNYAGLISAIYLYDKDKNGYILIGDGSNIDENEEMSEKEICTLFWDTVRQIPQEDLDIISCIDGKGIEKYNPSFILNVKCNDPSCTYHKRLQMSLDHLLFLRAEDMPEEVILES